MKILILYSYALRLELYLRSVGLFYFLHNLFVDYSSLNK